MARVAPQPHFAPNLAPLAQLLDARPTRSDRLDARTNRILARVRAIPIGFVRTYGDIDPKAPRMVGHVLAATRERLPWHRVVRADGSMAKGDPQRRRLIKEGVPMRGERVDLRIARLPSSF
jgi:methylated-DNA-protein-cysteine methyltransferase-like protein